MDKHSILVVEDNEINRMILVNMLKNDYNILEASNGEEAIELLEQSPENISGILLDIVMPVLDGYGVLREIKRMGLDSIPVIVMTGEKDPESEEKALALGAWDFVSKPYQARVLKSRLSNAIARSELSLLKKIKHMAEHDAVTGLYNRRHFFEITETMTKHYKDDVLAFVKMDINRFKLVNSFYGENGGDRLLRYISELLESELKVFEHCTYGRIEADNFGFCIPFDKEKCEKVIKIFIKKISEYSKDFLLEPCFGIYIIENHDMKTEDMFIRASMAAEKTKDQYMNYIGYYDNAMGDRLFQDQQILGQAQGGIDNNEFVVYLQPKYDMKTMKPYGAEALVRWIQPGTGMVSPGLFIPVFEKNGFIGKLDIYMWEKVCELIRGWIDEGINPAPISVNMSRVDVSNPKLVDILSDLVKKYDIPPRLLNLELTESAYMDNPENINSVIDKLHDAGFQIFMDDFGSGYSSLNTLKDFEVDVLKIDMKFIPVDTADSKSRKILTSVVRMAQWINLPVIVEGVETKEQCDYLKSIGCEYIQGYYFARPMPVSEYEELIMA